jgi:hypothetical protein
VSGLWFFGEVERFEVFGLHQADRVIEHFIVGADVALSLAEAFHELAIELGA